MNMNSSKLSDRIRMAGGVVLAAGVMSVAVLGATAGAQTGVCVDSPNTVHPGLLNDGVNNTTAPVTVDIPAGVYDIAYISDDTTHLDVVDPTQNEEQWAIVGAGWASPFTVDIPIDQVRVTGVWSGVSVPDLGSVTFVHRGVGNINSVDPVSVCFSPVVVPTTTTEAPTTTTEAPVTTVTPTTETPSTVAPTTTETPEVTTTAKTVETSSTVLTADDTPVLAVTGVESWQLTLVAMFFIVSGAVMVRYEAETA